MRGSQGDDGAGGGSIVVAAQIDVHPTAHLRVPLVSGLDGMAASSGDLGAPSLLLFLTSPATP